MVDTSDVSAETLFVSNSKAAPGNRLGPRQIFELRNSTSTRSLNSEDASELR
jgi:hypothetical protein